MTHNRVVAWIGVGAIVLSLHLPFISIAGIVELTGFEMVMEISDLMSEFVTSDGGGDGSIGDGSSEGVDLSFEELAFLIAILLFLISPFFFIFSAIVSTIALLSEKSPKLMGSLHLGYALLFVVSGLFSPSALGLSIFDFIGIGFYIGAFSSICIFVYNPPSRGNYRSRIPSHMSHDFEEEYEEEAEFPIWIIFFVPVSVITLIALFLIVPFMIFILALSLLVAVMLILKISSSEDEDDFSEEDIVEYKQSIYQDSKTSTGEILQVGSKDHYVKNWEELPQGEWLETDANGTHWYQTHNGIIWYSTEEGYRVREDS